MRSATQYWIRANGTIKYGPYKTARLRDKYYQYLSQRYPEFRWTIG